MPNLAQTKLAIGLIGAATGWGARRHHSEDGPAALQASGLVEQLLATGIPAHWLTSVYPALRYASHQINQQQEALPLVLAHVQDVAIAVADAVKQDYFPVVLGGDHSVAIGTWSGLTQALGLGQNLGLLWLDAHLDSHTFATSPSKACHGMGLATLLGQGETSLVDLQSVGGKLSPKQVAVIGARSFEAEEVSLLQQLGVRVFLMTEVAERGLDTVLAEALEIVTDRTGGFGLSLDLDSLDPSDAPGVGVPEAGGIKAAELLAAFRLIRQHPGLKAIEIVEYTPQQDMDQRTAQLVAQILKALL
ncbi:arginase [Leptolyngbya sp. FACHB-261]|uniref:arginase n=1 Tax=Leptolyngbya sp. FACHB-261 TaxID=2692806 RepID=UPI001683F4BC|nr:arginase [Leptolyngbya sp. FACHB-261]MBD2103971.1 arginase [Leptolyngbya sp. FACHB-261]